MENPKRVNVNVGILGHVDSGKTALAKALSTIGSTAAFDENPQSRERGITIDLGFSCFPLGQKWNFTLVDCPGHASLIKTVIGGVQIMDIMLLCVDAVKGLQAQGKECLTIAKLTCDHLVVVVTKMDLIEASQREMKMFKIKTMIGLALKETKFAGCPVTFASATDPSIGVGELKVALLKIAEEVTFVRDSESPFVMAIDHCFMIRGQGTILTGTILQGKLKISDNVEIPSQKIVKKVKSIQSFKIPLTEASCGDRVGICLPGIDATKLERGLIAAPGYVRTAVTCGVVAIDRNPSIKNSIQSDHKYQVSIGYESVETKVTIMRTVDGSGKFDSSREYEYVELLDDCEPDKPSTENGGIGPDNFHYFAILHFKIPVMIAPNPFVIGADLALSSSPRSRIVFSGRLVDFTEDKTPKDTYNSNIKIFRQKVKVGKVDRIRSSDEVLVVGFCKKESMIQYLIGLKVVIIGALGYGRNQHLGTIEGRFGQTTKLLIRLARPIPDDHLERAKSSTEPMQVYLKYKKYIYSKDSNKLIQ